MKSKLKIVRKIPEGNMRFNSQFFNNFYMCRIKGKHRQLGTPIVMQSDGFEFDAQCVNLSSIILRNPAKIL